LLREGIAFDAVRLKHLYVQAEQGLCSIKLPETGITLNNSDQRVNAAGMRVLVIKSALVSARDTL
jgi:hypothetical protein